MVMFGNLQYPIIRGFRTFTIVLNFLHPLIIFKACNTHFVKNADINSNLGTYNRSENRDPLEQAKIALNASQILLQICTDLYRNLQFQPEEFLLTFFEVSRCTWQVFYVHQEHRDESCESPCPSG